MTRQHDPQTKEIEIEEALRESEPLLRSIVEQSYDGIRLVDEEGVILEWNRGNEQIMGLKRDDVVGRFLWDVLFQLTPDEDKNPAMYERLKSAVLASRKTKRQTWSKLPTEHTVQRPDGTRRIVQTVIFPIQTDLGFMTGGITRDITGRIHMEEALRESEKRFRLLYEHAPLGYQSLDENGCFLEVNPAWSGMTGYTRDEVLGRWYGDFLDPEYREQFQQNFALFLATGEEHGVEYKLIRKDEALVIVTVDGRIGYDEQGKFKQTHCILTDITERKRAEEALRQSEEKYRILFDRLNDAAFLASAETGVILEANKQAEVLLGRIRNEIIGMHRSQLHPPEGEEHYRQQFAARAAGVTSMHDSHIIRKDETIVPVIISGGLVTVEGKSCVLGLFRDVTEQKRAEEALRQSEERFHMLSQATSEGVGIAEKGIVVDVSARFADMLGYEPEEIIGRPVADFVAPEDRAFVQQQIRAGFDEPYEHKALCKDGSVIVVEAYGRPTTYLGRPARMTVIRDITERKQAEQQRFELAVERERIEVLQQFISDASHDLRTPLTAIKSGLYLLTRTIDPARQQERLAMMDTQIDHLEKLLDDMLNMSLLDTEAEFIFTPLDLNTLIQAVLVEQNPLAARKNHQLRFTSDANILPIVADETYLNRAISNVVMNALQFTPDGGQITIQIYQQNNHAVIEVQDTGMGISADDLPHIFKRFYRADKARSMDTGGTGLGLSIAQKIVEMHRGRIEVESEPGKGSTFRILLPLDSAA